MTEELPCNVWDGAARRTGRLVQYTFLWPLGFGGCSVPLVYLFLFHISLHPLLPDRAFLF